MAQARRVGKQLLVPVTLISGSAASTEISGWRGKWGKSGGSSGRNRGHGVYLHICRDVPGTYRVHLDIVFAPFIAEGFGELCEATLGRCIGRNGNTALKVPD